MFCPPPSTLHSKYPKFLKFSAIALAINSLFSTTGYSNVLSLDSSHFKKNNGNKVYTIKSEDQLGKLSLQLPSSSQNYVLTAESGSIAVDDVTSTVIKITGTRYSDENSSIEIGNPMIIGNNNANQTVNSSSLISFDDGADGYVMADFSTGNIRFQNITLKSSSSSATGIIDASFSGWADRFDLDFEIAGNLTFDNISYIFDENNSDENKNKHLINLYHNNSEEGKDVIVFNVTGSTKIDRTTSNSFVRSENATASLKDVTVTNSHFNEFLNLFGKSFEAGNISISNTEIHQLVHASQNDFEVNSISYVGSSEGTFLSKEMNFMNFTDSSVTINDNLSIQNLDFSSYEGTSAHLIEFENSSQISIDIDNSLTGPDEYAIDLQNIDFYANTQVYQEQVGKTRQ